MVNSSGKQNRKKQTGSQPHGGYEMRRGDLEVGVKRRKASKGGRCNNCSQSVRSSNDRLNTADGGRMRLAVARCCDQDNRDK